MITARGVSIGKAATSSCPSHAARWLVFAALTLPSLFDPLLGEGQAWTPFRVPTAFAWTSSGERLLRRLRGGRVTR